MIPAKPLLGHLLPLTLGFAACQGYKCTQVLVQIGNVEYLEEPFRFPDEIRSYRICLNELLQLRVLRFGLLQDGDVGVVTATQPALAGR